MDNAHDIHTPTGVQPSGVAQVLPPRSHAPDPEFSLDQARSQEAHRRLRLLGADIASTPYDLRTLRARAHDVQVRLAVLHRFKRCYDTAGIDGLEPEWEALSAHAQGIARARYAQLGDLTRTEIVTCEDITRLAERQGWPRQRAERWVRRYQEGGLWGLAPSPRFSPRPRRQGVKRESPDLGSLVGAELTAAIEDIHRHLTRLGPLAEQLRPTTEDIRRRAEEVGVSERALRYDLATLRNEGPSGLRRKPRCDKDRRHNISDTMETLIWAIRLTKRDWTVPHVLEEACTQARQLGELEPSEAQVRSIIDRIPKPILALADGREAKFRNSYRITYRMHWGERVIIQVDWTLVTVLCKDLRHKGKGRSRDGQTRLHLLRAKEAGSRKVVGSRFTYLHPDRYDVAALIRDVLLSCGVPDEIWVDHGLEFNADHIKHLVRDHEVILHLCYGNNPQERGIIERSFRELDQKLWSKETGYVGINVVERNPHAKATKTPAQLEATYLDYVDKYNNTVHVETGMTPCDYWTQHRFCEPVDPRALDIMLKEATKHTVMKEGIHHNGQWYWDEALSNRVGEDVTVRSGPVYTVLKDVEVFHDGRWICRASINSADAGSPVPRETIAAAQREQRNHAREVIAQARAACTEAQERIAALSALPTAAIHPDTRVATGEASTPVCRRQRPGAVVDACEQPSIWDYLAPGPGASPQGEQ